MSVKIEWDMIWIFLAGTLMAILLFTLIQTGLTKAMGMTKQKKNTKQEILRRDQKSRTDDLRRKQKQLQRQQRDRLRDMQRNR